jgi:Transposase IS66 family
MSKAVAISLSETERLEVASWIGENRESFPLPVRKFLAAHIKYLSASEDMGRRFDETYRELRRALGITASSERRRSGAPLAAVPREMVRLSSGSEVQRLMEQQDRSMHLGLWHSGLADRHTDSAARSEEKIVKAKECMRTEELRIIKDMPPVESIQLSPEQEASNLLKAQKFVENLGLGDGADPEFQSVNESLMPEGAVVTREHVEHLTAEASEEEFANAREVKTLKDKRVRYDISISVNRIELEVEKKVMVKENGERTVVAATTDGLGPARYRVTWSALATLAILVGQFAFPLNRLATLFSCVGKRFTAGGLSRLLHYVAVRLAAIYIELGEQLSDSEILGGDDTPCRVLEANAYFEKQKASKGESEKKKPPWDKYRSPAAAEESIRQCEEQKRARMKRRAEGERDAKGMPDEEPSLGMLIGRHHEFESPRQDGQGAKQSMNTTVISGRSIAKDPRSLIVFYRSHLGGCGNLLESILRSRNPSAKDIIMQADLSTTNLVRDPELLKRFNFKLIGCSAHARRPFALYEHEDPVYGPFMVHLFKGIAIHEGELDVYGRNRQNVLAVRQTDSRGVWEKIRTVAEKVKEKWSKASKLGQGARYILKHYDKLTAYLDDPRLEPSNNLRERMLRTEKLIENSSMFRRSLEGRFVLDIIRTVLQTATAAGVPVHEYLMSVLKEDPDEVNEHPEKYTPLAYAERTAPVAEQN